MEPQLRALEFCFCLYESLNSAVHLLDTLNAAHEIPVQ